MKVSATRYKQSDTLSTFKKRIEIGTVIDATVGSTDRITKEWGFYYNNFLCFNLHFIICNY